MPFAAALSEHPSPVEAVAEVVGEVLEALGPAPDLAVVVVSEPLTPHLGDVAAAVRALLAPEVLLGAVAPRVLSGDREIERGPAVSLWAAEVGSVRGVRLAPRRAGPGEASTSIAEGARGTLVLLADPATFPAASALDGWAQGVPGVTVVGGLVGGAGPGSPRLVLDGAVHRDGAVGVLLGPDVASVAVVAQGCRPVGEPMTVTAAEGPVLLELAGRPALDRLDEVSGALPADDRFLLDADPHVGIVLDEHRERFSTGDFVVRRVLGRDAERGGLLLGESIPVGTTVQVQVRDATSAGEELRRVLAGACPDPSVPAGALVFSSGARASLEVEERDAALVSERVGPAVVGLGCAGEIGPAFDRSRIHVASAAVVVLAEPGGAGPG